MQLYTLVTAGLWGEQRGLIRADSENEARQLYQDFDALNPDPFTFDVVEVRPTTSEELELAALEDVEVLEGVRADGSPIIGALG